MLLTQQQLTVMCEICCEFFIFQRNNMSAQWVRTASVSVSPVSDLHPRLFHQACGSSTQIWTQWTTNFAQKFSSASNLEKFTTWTDRHIGTTGHAIGTRRRTAFVYIGVSSLFINRFSCSFFVLLDHETDFLTPSINLKFVVRWRHNFGGNLQKKFGNFSKSCGKGCANDFDHLEAAFK